MIGSPVTVADRAAEAAAREMIEKTFSRRRHYRRGTRRRRAPDAVPALDSRSDRRDVVVRSWRAPCTVCWSPSKKAMTAVVGVIHFPALRGNGWGGAWRRLLVERRARSGFGSERMSQTLLVLCTRAEEMRVARPRRWLATTRRERSHGANLGRLLRPRPGRHRTRRGDVRSGAGTLGCNRTGACNRRSWRRVYRLVRKGHADERQRHLHQSCIGRLPCGEIAGAALPRPITLSPRPARERS